MAPLAAQPHAQDPGAHLLLYDGVCGLCSRGIRLIARLDRHRAFRFASLQSPLGQSVVARAGGNPTALASFYVLLDRQSATSPALTKSDAVIFVAEALGWPWKMAGLLRLLPRGVRDRAYDFIARHRYRVFGRHELCTLVDPEVLRRTVG